MTGAVTLRKNEARDQERGQSGGSPPSPSRRIAFPAPWMGVIIHLFAGRPDSRFLKSSQPAGMQPGSDDVELGEYSSYSRADESASKPVQIYGWSCHRYAISSVVCLLQLIGNTVMNCQ